ncbi:hypothetical protein NUACC26_073870 [Scytonema sp. NUACC26]
MKLTKLDRMINFFFENQDKWFTCRCLANYVGCSMGTANTYANDLVRNYPSNYYHVITQVNHRTGIKEYCCVRR